MLEFIKNIFTGSPKKRLYRFLKMIDYEKVFIINNTIFIRLKKSNHINKYIKYDWGNIFNYDISIYDLNKKNINLILDDLNFLISKKNRRKDMIKNILNI